MYKPPKGINSITMKLKLILLTFLLAVQGMFALTLIQDVPEVDLTNVNTLVAIVTPLVTLAATWLLKKILPFITGIKTLVVVPIVAGIFTLLSDLLFTHDLSFIVQLVAGIGAVFIHQLYVQLTQEE